PSPRAARSTAPPAETCWRGRFARTSAARASPSAFTGKSRSSALRAAGATETRAPSPARGGRREGRPLDLVAEQRVVDQPLNAEVIEQQPELVVRLQQRPLRGHREPADQPAPALGLQRGVL